MLKELAPSPRLPTGVARFFLFAAICKERGKSSLTRWMKTSARQSPQLEKMSFAITHWEMSLRKRKITGKPCAGIEWPKTSSAAPMEAG